MRVASTKEQKLRSQTAAQQSHMQSVDGQEPAQSSVAIPQSQPLQARSSNSGTSVKRSDNISQSSYPVGDIVSEKATNSYHRQGSSAANVAPVGHLTNAFASQKRETLTSNPTAMSNKEQMAQPSVARRVAAQRKATTDTTSSVANSNTPIHGTHSSAGVATRASGRLTRAAELRAVKELPIAHQGSTAKSITSQLAKAETALKPVKQANSETGTMRTTRSKSKAQQHDKLLSERVGPSESCATSRLSNGQSDLLSRNLEKIEDVPMDQKSHKVPEVDTCGIWQREEGKQQSPRSQNSSINVGGTDKLGNQSLMINDSTDSLLENPLTSVIKQFQNLRNNAQLTGKNKPTIQQFLEKFEKEMQYLEDQYQAQQQAREEQMRLFEQQYGAKGSLEHQQKYPGQPHPYQVFCPNDQPYASKSALPNAPSAHNDTIMIQDTSTFGPMPHDNSNNSFVSAVHGPNQNNGSVFGGASSEVTSSEVYESFQFTQNSMLSFYPRQVRKILTRRKTVNFTNTSIADLKELKPPKHRKKIAKNMTKMHGLAVCQMNMMQILLQKISRRSKVIRKQEKIVNENLKRKRIYLEKEKFDLMSVLRKSLEAAEAQGPSSSQSTMALQKSKTKTLGSDLNSRCPSTAGTKSGNDQPTTQSAREINQSSMYVQEITSVDGLLSRKQNRLLSGVENCSSQAESAPNQNIQARSITQDDNNANRQVDLNAVSVSATQEQQLMRAAEKMKKAVHLSEIDDSSLNVDKAGVKSQKSMHAQSNHHTFNEQSHHVQGEAVYSQAEKQDTQYGAVTPKKGNTVGLSSLPNLRHQSETPAYEQSQTRLGAQDLENGVSQASNTGQVRDLVAEAAASRKVQSTQNRQRKRKSNLAALEQEQVPARNLLENLYEGQGSYAIADLQGQQDLPQQQLDGKVSLNLKGQDQRQSETVQAPPMTQQRSENGRSKKKRASKMSGVVDGSHKNTQQQVVIKAANVPEVQNAQHQASESRQDNQRKLSPFQDLEQENNLENATNGHQIMQHHALMHSNTMPPMNHYMHGHLPVEATGYYPGMAMMGEAMEMQPDQFMMGEHPKQGIFNDFMKQAAGGETTGHEQPLVSAGQMAEMALHRSQSVMLPHQQMFQLGGPNLMDPMAPVNFEQFGHQNLNESDHGAGITPPNVQQPQAKNNMMDPFFDESAQELSAIEQSAADPGHMDFNSGFNPYEQAKRQALKKQNQVANTSQPSDQGQPHQTLKVEQAQMHHFASPMPGIQHLSAQHTPQNSKIGPETQPGPIMVDVTSTPSHFMSGVDVAAANAGLGRGHALAQHSQQMQQQDRDVHQLSVSRLCNDPFNISGGYHQSHGQRHQGSSEAGQSVHHLSAMRGNFGHTPAGLMSNGQQMMADSQRQHLSVSGWNLEDPTPQSQMQVAGTGQVRVGDQLYQGLPDTYM